MSCASDVIEKLTVITVIAASYHGKIVTSSVGIIGIAPNIIGRIMPAAARSVVRRRTRAACAARTRCTRAPHGPHARAACVRRTRYPPHAQHKRAARHVCVYREMESDASARTRRWGSLRRTGWITVFGLN